MQHLLPQLGGAGEIALSTTMAYLILAKGQLPPGFSILELPSWTLSWANMILSLGPGNCCIPPVSELLGMGFCMLVPPSRAERFLSTPVIKNHESSSSCWSTIVQDSLPWTCKVLRLEFFFSLCQFFHLLILC